MGNEINRDSAVYFDNGMPPAANSVDLLTDGRADASPTDYVATIFVRDVDFSFLSSTRFAFSARRKRVWDPRAWRC